MVYTSSKSHMVSFRLSNEAYDRILKALDWPSNPNSGVPDYCKTVVERWVFRHDKTNKHARIDKVGAEKQINIRGEL